MIKFIKYHFLYLFNKKWLLFIAIISLLSALIFFFLGSGHLSEVERLLNMKELIKAYDYESFIVINLLIGFWVINAIKELFILEEPHILLIHKRKYIQSKIIAYTLFYFLVTLFIYSVYMSIRLILFGLRPFSNLFLFNLLLNILLIHLLMVVIGGKNKNILLSISLFIIFILINGLYFIDYWLLNMVLFFIPYLNFEYPLFGYVHTFLVILLLNVIAFYKHFSDLA